METLKIIGFICLFIFLSGVLNGVIRTLKTYEARSKEINQILDNLEKEGKVID